MAMQYIIMSTLCPQVESTTLETIMKRGEKGKEIDQLKVKRAQLEDEQQRQQTEFDKVIKDEQDAMDWY